MDYATTVTIAMFIAMVASFVVVGTCAWLEVPYWWVLLIPIVLLFGSVKIHHHATHVCPECGHIFQATEKTAIENAKTKTPEVKE